MESSVQGRMYARLTDLVPQLEQQPQGAIFFAAPKQKGDMSLYCNVNWRTEQLMDLEIAHDLIDPTVPGETWPAPWLMFRLDVSKKTATLMAIQEGASYEVVQSDDGRVSPRRPQLNMFAANWLNIMINLQFVFAPVIRAEATV